jgi:hypothetical protein
MRSSRCFGCRVAAGVRKNTHTCPIVLLRPDEHIPLRSHVSSISKAAGGKLTNPSSKGNGERTPIRSNVSLTPTKPSKLYRMNAAGNDAVPVVNLHQVRPFVSLVILEHTGSDTDGFLGPLLKKLRQLKNACASWA